MPLPGWLKPNDGYSALAIANHISVKQDGKIRWNGKEISPEQLSRYSSITSRMNPIPFTILQVDNGASCGVVRKVRDTINEHAKCAEVGGICGEGGGPWAQIGDVIGPNGETYRYFPDGRVETIQPAEKARAQLNAVRNEVDALAEEANNREKR